NLTNIATTGGATSPHATGTFTSPFSDTVNLPVGSTITYTVTAKIDPAATGTLSNTATVTAPAGFTEANTGNNTAIDSDTLTPEPDLTATKSHSGALQVGGSFTWTIHVANGGNANATFAADQVILSDVLPTT